MPTPKACGTCLGTREIEWCNVEDRTIYTMICPDCDTTGDQQMSNQQKDPRQVVNELLMDLEHKFRPKEQNTAAGAAGRVEWDASMNMLYEAIDDLEKA